MELARFFHELVAEGCGVLLVVEGADLRVGAAGSNEVGYAVADQFAHRCHLTRVGCGWHAARVQFYRIEPTAQSSWRMAVLMGANSRTYKFALGSALLAAAEEGRESLTLAELATPYALGIARRVQRYPQAPAKQELAPSDFLTIATQEAQASLAAGEPTPRLLEAAMTSMPAMVMQKFHNLRDAGTGSAVPHTFYEVRGRGPARRVHLTPDLHAVAATAAVLHEELDARWSIVEASFDAGIGSSLVHSGVVLSADGHTLRAPIRRANVTSARHALAGFQHGRCFYCHTVLTSLERDVHVDHVLPYSWMRTGSWRGPDLNAVWNLVVACAGCNLAKSSRRPTEPELHRLVARNEAIMGSPHPLKRTLQLTMRAPAGREANTAEQRLAFLRDVVELAVEGIARPRR